MDEIHWVMGGDFNIITSLDKKKRGQRSLEGECLLFREAIKDMGLVDIIYDDDIFTWNKKRGGSRHIACHLD